MPSSVSEPWRADTGGGVCCMHASSSFRHDIGQGWRYALDCCRNKEEGGGGGGGGGGEDSDRWLFDGVVDVVA